MEIYRQIGHNKLKTYLFLLAFILLLTFLGYTFGLLFAPELGFAIMPFIFLFSSAAAFTGYYFSEKIVMKMAHARPVDKSREPYLYHTIEGVAIAAGIPTPKAYVIETDLPNAFATGRNPQNSAVAVTRGLMDKMNREELEGVIAHEMAHIKNYDVLYATIAVVLVGTTIFLADILTRSLFFGRMHGRGSVGRRGKDGSQALLLVIGILAAIIAPLLARLLQMAISRKREYLADATAANMLGYPQGLANALAKLADYSDPEKARESGLSNKALQGLFIINPLTSRANLQALFSTHPPLKERITRLEKM